MFRSRRTSRLLVLALLWAAEASAGSRISLLPFEGDRPRPLRWRVAYALKRAGHVVLGYAPPGDRSSAASLRSYADRRRVDLFVSGTSEETPQGWRLALRFRNADGQAVGQPVTFRAESLKGLLWELRKEGPDTLERSVPGSSQSAVAELPPGRALPLPKRRARPRRARSDQPVLPGATPPDEVAAESDSSRSGPPAKEGQLASSASSSKGVTWDADAPAPGGRRKDASARRRSAERSSRSTAGSGALFAAMVSRRGKAVDLDADTRDALEEEPAAKRRRNARAVREEQAAAEATPDPLAEPAAPREASSAAVPAEAAGDPVVIDADALDDVGPPESEPEPKPRKKPGLFAGRFTADGRLAGEDGSSEERDSGSDESSSLRTPPHAQLSARAGFLHRSLAYSDDLYNRLRAPTTNGWVYRIEASLYPFAPPLKERFSLIGSYEGALAGTVRDSRTKRDFSVEFSEISGGARLRFPLGEHELGAQATVGRTAAGLDESASVTGVPEVNYIALRPAADLTMNFSALSLRAALGYQRVLGGFGEMASADWFPHMDGYGFDSQLGLDYRLSPTVTLQALGSLRRFVLDMNSRPDDALVGQAEVAGGAVDQYVSGYLGVMVAL